MRAPAPALLLLVAAAGCAAAALQGYVPAGLMPPGTEGYREMEGKRQGGWMGACVVLKNGLGGWRKGAEVPPPSWA